MNDLIQHDQQQRELALDAGKSFIVQAPAGSGKTELLIQRFLTLLIHVKMPEEILAITFTKKAANEMRLRVIKALKHALSEPEPESAHAKQTWRLARQVLERDHQFNWHLINNPNQLRIQTIDSLCSYLTKQLPLLSHFGSQPDIAMNPAPLYREAVREVLLHVEENYEWSQAISTILLHLDNDLNKLHDLFVALLSKRDQWLSYIQFDNDPAMIRKLLENHLAAIIADSLQNLVEVFPEEIADELFACARFAADNISQTKNNKSNIIACKDIQQLPGIKPVDKPIWLGLAKLLLTDEGNWRKSFNVNLGFPSTSNIQNAQEKILFAEYKQRIMALIVTLQGHDDLRLNLFAVNNLPEPCYQDSQWEILQSLLRVLKIIIAQLRLTFQQHGQIDFIENARAALLALGNDEAPTDLALALDYQIRHILIDEFQDTAFTQYQLIEKLTTGWETNDGRTLFVVGDPMQSIYRFREAEVGLFIRMCKNGIGNIKLTPLTLSLNFRSTAKIVEWNNNKFSKIFPSFNDIASGAVTYSKSIAYHSHDDENTQITIQGFSEDNENNQSCNIAELIEETIKRYPAEKIAVLVRSRAHLTQIIPELKKKKIPYRALDIDPLASKQCIQDLLSLTSALLHQADRIAWLSVLRAPWCGLTLADLLLISGNTSQITIWERLQQPELIKQLSAGGQKRLMKTFPILKTKVSERERYNLRFWVESTWLLLGGPACLDDISAMDDAKAYFQLLEDFSQDSRTINLDKLKEKITELYASTQHDDAILQIMTIHTAKGLEFDTVILPHLERKSSSGDKSLLLWMEQPLNNDKIALLLAPIHATGNNKDPVYEFINRQQRIKSDYETDRLLYVAATRAKKRLHIFFNIGKNEDQQPRIESGSFLEKLWPLIEKQYIVSRIKHDIVTEKNDDKIPRYISRLTASWINPIEDASSFTFAAHQKQSGFLLPDNTARFIGVVIHKILQKIAYSGVSWWTVRNTNEQANYVRYQLTQMGVSGVDISGARQIILNALQNTLNDSRGQWILKLHAEARSEFAISAVIDNKIEQLIIDRTFIDENGTRWIIDYKTSTLSNQDLTSFLAEEQDKYREKMQQYCQAMKFLDERPVRLGLYFPAIPAWHEWEGE